MKLHEKILLSTTNQKHRKMKTKNKCWPTLHWLSHVNKNIYLFIHLCNKACVSPFMGVSWCMWRLETAGPFWFCAIYLRSEAVPCWPFPTASFRRWMGRATVGVSCLKIETIHWTERGDHCGGFGSPRPTDCGKGSLVSFSMLNRRSPIKRTFLAALQSRKSRLGMCAWCETN